MLTFIAFIFPIKLIFLLLIGVLDSTVDFFFFFFSTKKYRNETLIKACLCSSANKIGIKAQESKTSLPASNTKKIFCVVDERVRVF